ncbi:MULTISPECIES: nitroreductase [unclassified Halomonas]|uniref:nitroreductase n=1 Tax=unclassified Halomonas TaxID=2609666 RepID=UPI00047FF111|nr:MULTISPECIES: nitroreductase [unclassified Halomonas]PKH59434.1 nitroreductase [Halomonas sp. Choline-3u-9]QGQ70614.1 nitroreductase [Halomonas sp. PA16-9]
MHVDTAITSRKSVRRFLDTPIDRATIVHIMQVASRAPSGSNIQPWKVHVVAGAAKDQLCQRLLAAVDQGQSDPPEYHYYPQNWFEPYLERRRRCGFGLYATLGIGREDKGMREAQARRNFHFFDAPVGLFITMDRRLETGSFMDCGMFIQSVMLAARGQGLHTCPQAAFAWYHSLIRDALKLDENQLLLCGISLGYEDSDAPENAFITEREDIGGFVTFH